MNLTAEQKKYLVPAAIGTVAFVLCDELLCKKRTGKFPTSGMRSGKLTGSGLRSLQSKGTAAKKSLQNSLMAAGASAVAGYFLYDKAKPETKATLDEYALPAGAAAATFAAVNRFAPVAGDRRPYALGAAAVGAFFANKQLSPSTPTVGMLPIFEPPFEPPFPPAFGPEFNG